MKKVQVVTKVNKITVGRFTVKISKKWFNDNIVVSINGDRGESIRIDTSRL
jgi:hypothetical protein